MIPGAHKSENISHQQNLSSQCISAVHLGNLWLFQLQLTWHKTHSEENEKTFLEQIAGIADSYSHIPIPNEINFRATSKTTPTNFAKGKDPASVLVL